MYAYTVDSNRLSVSNMYLLLGQDDSGFRVRRITGGTDWDAKVLAAFESVQEQPAAPQRAQGNASPANEVLDATAKLMRFAGAALPCPPGLRAPC